VEEQVDAVRSKLGSVLGSVRAWVLVDDGSLRSDGIMI
jgi:hypothetical protein